MPVLPSYRNQSVDFLCKSIDWFLYEGNTATYWVKFDIDFDRALSKTSKIAPLNHQAPMSPLDRNQSIDWQCKSTEWFLYDNYFCSWLFNVLNTLTLDQRYLQRYNHCEPINSKHIWNTDVVVITTAQLHSKRLELRKRGHNVLEVCNV